VQHGSILLSIDSALWAKVVGHDAANELHAVGVNELVEASLPLSELVNSLAAEFERAMGEPAAVHELSPFEKESAAHLAKTKYSSANWTVFRRASCRAR
jgi:lipoate-protein ligase A